MHEGTIKRGWRTAILAVAASAAITLGTATSAVAEGSAVQLSITPVGVAGSYFDLTVSPGETRELEVLIGNHGTAPVRARTYPADVYSIINGGFGARLSGESTSGTTLWVAYPDDVLSIPPASGVLRTFTLTVPADAPAGEHITSLIVQNEDPVTTGTGIAIRQVVRQAIAIALTVRGPLVPGLSIGAARHSDVAGRSVIAVEVENTGNVRLRPSAELTLTDVTGSVVSKAQVSLDSVYASTATLVEVPLAALLRPGQYRIDLTLADAEHNVRTEATALAVTVVSPPAPGSAAGGAVRELTEVAQEFASRVSRTNVFDAVSLGGVALALAAIIVAIAGMLPRRRPRRAHASTLLRSTGRTAAVTPMPAAARRKLAAHA